MMFECKSMSTKITLLICTRIQFVQPNVWVSIKYHSGSNGCNYVQLQKEYFRAVDGVFRTVDQNFIVVLEGNYNFSIGRGTFR